LVDGDGNCGNGFKFRDDLQWCELERILSYDELFDRSTTSVPSKYLTPALDGSERESQKRQIVTVITADEGRKLHWIGTAENRVQ
jgi:hypothetical protein